MRRPFPRAAQWTFRAAMVCLSAGLWVWIIRGGTALMEAWGF